MSNQEQQTTPAGAASELTAELAGYPLETLAGWYCELNCYEWPADFPANKPEGWDHMTHQQRHELPEMRIAYDAVDAAVPRKEKSRAWHKGGYTGEPKTDAQFEDWWRTTGRAYFEPANYKQAS